MYTNSIAVEAANPTLAHPRLIDSDTTESSLTVPFPGFLPRHPGGSLPRPPQGGNNDIILPKWIYIQDSKGRYLTFRPDSGIELGTLTFRSGAPDLLCVVQTEGLGPNQYRLLASNGDPIDTQTLTNSKTIKWVFANAHEYDHLSTVFTLTLARENISYIRDTYGFFMSNLLNRFDAPIARNFINEDSEMTITVAAVKTEILDIQYDIPGGVVRQSAPRIALSTSVQNSSSSSDTTQTLQYSYEKWSVGTWNNVAGIEIGAKTEFSAGVPFVASAKFEISLSASYSHEWGGEQGVRETVTSSTAVVVPPRKKANATVIIRNAQLDIGFTYTARTLWTDGRTDETKKSGTYKNVDSWHVDVQVSDWEDI